MSLSSSDHRFIQYLQKNCHTIDFFQMVRFLYRLVKKADGDPLYNISITPSSYIKRLPETQVIALNETGDACFEVEYNEFAMYGTHSCLPEGLTTRINVYESYGHTEPKAFIDLFHTYLHHLSFKNQLANKTLIKLIEHDQLPHYTSLVHQLAGIPSDFFGLDDRFSSWVQYRRLLTGKNKNSIGLQRLLELFFFDRDLVFNFTIEEGYMQRETASDSKLHPIGDAENMLGRTSYIGSVFQNTQSCITFHFALDTLEQYYEFVYGEWIHTFTKLALAYCGVAYFFVFAFDDIYSTSADTTHSTTRMPQLGVSSMLFNDPQAAPDVDTVQSIERQLLLAAHEFIYTETLGQQNKNDHSDRHDNDQNTQNQAPMEQTA